MPDETETPNRADGTEALQHPGSHEPIATRSATVRASREAVYELWRRPTTLPAIMHHFADVTVQDEHHARWKTNLPIAGTYEWVTRLTETEPGMWLSWATVEGSSIPNVGILTLRDAPQGKGTEMTLEVRFDPPGGMIGSKLAKALGVVPKEIVSKALYRFRALLETGEIPTINGQPAGNGIGRMGQA